MKSNRLIDIIDLDGEVDIISENIKTLEGKMENREECDYCELEPIEKTTAGGSVFTIWAPWCTQHDQKCEDVDSCAKQKNRRTL